MPRGARLDTPGTLHHVMVRGIEKRRIVEDLSDRKAFVDRLGMLATETKTSIYAWALLDNHAHILLRSSKIGLSTFMRRMLTGYAIYFNRRHKRWGHLFQNRYKSIICDEDAYFMELVRYIHLNPLRTELVNNLNSLDRYHWGGHATLMGNVKYDWQDCDYVLAWFGAKRGTARRAYRKYVEKGIEQGRRSDLVGGGLIRSMGGWSAVKAMRRTEPRELGDERILGSGEFVEKVIKEAESQIKYQLPLIEQHKRIDEISDKICKQEKVSIEEVKGGSRRRKASRARARIAITLVEKNGMSQAETARRLGVCTSAISKILERTKH